MGAAAVFPGLLSKRIVRPFSFQIFSASSIAESTKVYGYETDLVPSWEEALKIWNEKGRTIRFDKRPGKTAAAASQARGQSSCEGNFRKTVALALVPAVLALLSYRFRILAA